MANRDLTTFGLAGLRFVLYTRVSNEDMQGDNFSIPSQLAAMRVWLEEQGAIIVAEFTEMESASQYGEGLDRTELGKARALAREHRIDGLMFYSKDRFTRDIGDGVILRREFSKLGIKLLCYYPRPHDVSENELLNIFEDYVSQQYVERMREASMRGYKQKARDGIFARGRAPYGYTVVGQKRDTQLVIVEDYARIVRLIYQWYTVDNLSTTQIAHKLTEAKVAAPGDLNQYAIRKRAAGVWSITSVWLILKNETYAGTWYACTRKAAGKHRTEKLSKEHWIAVAVPAIVDRATWQAAQEKLAERDYERRTKSTKKHDYLLSRRVTCGCTAAMHGVTRTNAHKEKRSYYRCQSYSMAAGFCGAPHFRAELVDTIVWRFALELGRNPEKLLKGYQEAQLAANEQSTVLQQQIALIDEQIRDYQDQLEDVLAMHRATKVASLKDRLLQDAEQYAQLVDELTAKRAKFAAQLQQETITDEHIASVAEHMHAMCDELEHIDRTNDLEAKRAAIELLNLRARLRVDSAGAKWVDVLWLKNIYSRPVSAKLDLSAPA